MFENCVVMADCITTSENSDNQGDENYFVVMEVENETVPESEENAVNRDDSGYPKSRDDKSIKVDIGEESQITFETFTNNGDDESLEALIILKNIFSRQLPKMPKDYIVRLVFDHRHRSLAIKLRGIIVGGICYRTYPSQRFAEIAFCAVSGKYQVQGLGTKLMNQLKCNVQRENTEYFLTYADNFAIGYFQKQGFSKSISMPRERWVGFIKDYDGGTLMECYIHPSLDYLHIPQIVAQQRAYIYNRIREISENSSVRYEGLELFKMGKRLASPADIPGVAEGGWLGHQTRGSTTDRDRQINQAKLTSTLKSLLDKIKAHADSWPFHEPVDAKEVPDYYVRIRNPVDLRLIASRLREEDYYRTKEMFRADLRRMVNNCKSYNREGSEYYEAAVSLEAYIQHLLAQQGDTGSMVGSVVTGVVGAVALDPLGGG